MRKADPNSFIQQTSEASVVFVLQGQESDWGCMRGSPEAPPNPSWLVICQEMQHGGDGCASHRINRNWHVWRFSGKRSSMELVSWKD